MTRELTIEHSGKTYYGFVATIERTTLGLEDHGIATAYLHLTWPGAGIGFGGYALDEPDPEREEKRKRGESAPRLGTAFGLDHLLAICRTVGVDTWENLKGKHVIVLFETKHPWGATAVGIANVINDDKVYIVKDHVAEWAARTSSVLA